MQSEILVFVVSVLPSWTLLGLEIWDRLHRKRKYKQSDGTREEVLKR